MKQDAANQSRQPGGFPAASGRPSARAEAAPGPLGTSRAKRPSLFMGCGTALITPFTAAGAVDEPALRRFLRWQIEEGVDFLVPGGSTGEAATLSREEHLRIVAIALEEARRGPRRVPVLAGAGGNNTQAVAALAREMKTLGAEGVLSVAPYYNKPSQEGLYQHFCAIAAAGLPVVLYNVPGRTASNLEPATVARLAAVENIVGIKEASGQIGQISAVLAGVPADFAVLAGDDGLALPTVALGGRGVISVASNEIPAAMTELVRLARSGDFVAARQLHMTHWPLFEANFLETNPVPVKAALAAMGVCQEVYRLPLTPMREATRKQLMQVLRALRLLPGPAVAEGSGDGRGPGRARS